MAFSLHTCTSTIISATIPSSHHVQTNYNSLTSLSHLPSFLSSRSLHSRYRLRAANSTTPFEKNDETNDSIGVAVSNQQSQSLLPEDIEKAILQASKSTATFISSGGCRAIVELLLPELEFLDDEGSQEKIWNLSKLFLESLKIKTNIQNLKAIFPDAGSAAMLKYAWKDAEFNFGSLNDRKPVDEDDEIIVMIAPDYQMLESVEKIAASISENESKPLIMWNPKLYSGDVGIGLNVKRLRKNFLSTFTVTYSLRTLAAGIVYRQYPSEWQIFVNDKERPGQYILASKQITRPDSEDIDMVFLGNKDGEQEEGPSLSTNVMSMISSFNRFLRSLSR